MRTYKSLSSIRRYWTVLISSVFILTFGFIAYHKISIKKEPPFPTFPSSSMMIHLTANATPYNLMEDDIWIAFTQSPKPYEAKDCSRGNLLYDATSFPSNVTSICLLCMKKTTCHVTVKLLLNRHVLNTLHLTQSTQTPIGYNRIIRASLI